MSIGMYRTAFLLIMLFSRLCFGQEQVVKGRVTDAETTSPIIGAVISIDQNGANTSSITDSLGFFIFRASIGRFDLSFSAPGYQTRQIPGVLVTSGKELDLQIELKPIQLDLKDITLKAVKAKGMSQMASVSAKEFNVEETQRYAASFNDPARMALSFAGVNTSNDASNEIVVRGNSARGLLWRVEGIEIPNPNHFSNGEGGSGGGISILSSQILSNSTFLTGAFPAEYGNALSGVFDIRFRKGNTDKREYSLQFGILGLQSSVEGPLSKKHSASYLVNYRYSTLIFLNAVGLPVVDNAIVPQFQDLSYNFFFPTKKIGTFTLFGLGGISIAGDLAVKDSTTWLVRSDRFEDKSFQFIGSTGLTHTLTLGNKGFWKTVAAVSKEENRYNMDSLNSVYKSVNTYNERIKYNVFRVHSFVNLKLPSNQIFRFGTYYSHYFYSIFSQGLNIQSNTFGTFSDEDGNTGLFQTYAQHKIHLSKNIHLVSGLHANYFILNKRINVEPRIGFQYQIRSRQTLSAGIGFHSRLEPVSVYLTRVFSDSIHFDQPNKDLKMTTSSHYILGYDLAFTAKMRLHSEVYFQYLFNVPVDTTLSLPTSVLNASAGLIQNAWVNEGKGRNYGIEITLEKNLDRGLYFMFTSSLFQSEYKLPNSEWLNTRFNANYMFNLLGGYEINFGKTKKKTLGINSRVIWRGGNRFTPIDQNLSVIYGYEVVSTDRPYTAQLPDYFRIDFSGSLRFNNIGWSLILSTEIQNITNRANVNRYYFDPYTKEIRTAYMFGIMPVFNIKFEF